MAKIRAIFFLTDPSIETMPVESVTTEANNMALAEATLPRTEINVGSLVQYVADDADAKT
jgi:hypothetical protein